MQLGLEIWLVDAPPRSTALPPKHRGITPEPVGVLTSS